MNVHRQIDDIIDEFKSYIHLSTRLEEEVEELRLCLQELTKKAVFTFDPMVICFDLNPWYEPYSGHIQGAFHSLQSGESV